MKWKTLQHNGILFPPAYEAQGIKIRIRGKTVDLSPIQEEMAYQWAKKKDTPYAQDEVFQRNFTNDFAKALGPEFEGIKYGEIDFSQAYKIVDMEKDRKERMSKEDRKALAKERKDKREELKEQYGKAILDGKEVEVGNYMAEPPGIFIGRGAHPLRGRWKARITQKDVTLNLGRKAKVPEGQWAEVVNNNDATWLACWVDELTQKTKYVWLADTASLKQERDREKYEKAVRLAGEIEKIKARMVSDMASPDDKVSRIATVCYLIYRTAMRVGDEKDPDEADTVGATTLRKEHVRITANAIEFDFLGKDSVRWQESVAAEGYDKQLQENLKKMIQNKKPKDEIFDKINSQRVNAYYSNIVKGLSAKVFRTYLATTIVKDSLKKHDDIQSSSQNKKLYYAKLANLEAAVMCNHKRTIPKTFEASLQKKRDKLKQAEADRPWTRAEETLKKVKDRVPKTDKQKQGKQKRIRTLKEQIKKRKERQKEKIEKMRLQVDLTERTKDYNLGTSLRNYIDPRVVKAWTDEVKAEWEKLYTAALQRKFLWVKSEKATWDKIKN